MIKFQRKKMLWIEDSARFELIEQMAPVYYSGEYILHLAENIVDGINHLRLAEREGKPYDVIIVDVRIPPGEDRVWQRLYKQTVRSRVESQLGLILLYWLFGDYAEGKHIGVESGVNPNAGEDIDKRLAELTHSSNNKPPAVKKGTVAVYTVEPPALICPHLEYLGIRVYAQKSIDTPDDILLRLARAVEEGGDDFRCHVKKQSGRA